MKLTGLSRRAEPPEKGNGRRRLLMLHDYPPLSGGGLALSALELARLVQRDFDCTLLSSRMADHFADDSHAVSRRGTRSRGALVQGATPSRIAIELLRGDLVMVHWTFSFRWLSTLVVLAAPFFRLPIICIVHTAPAHMEYNRLQRVPRTVRRVLVSFVSRSLGRGAFTVALSESHAEDLRKAGFPVNGVLPIPVVQPHQDHEAYSPRSSVIRTVGVATELSRLKGSDDLMHLLRSLTKRLQVRIVGGGPLTYELEEAISRLPPTQKSNVCLSGRLDPDEMPHFYREVDCVLILSRSESQCRVALEAMLSGAIVLARPVSGLVDLIDEGLTGFFIDPTCPTRIMELLNRLHHDQALVADVRNRARERALRHFEASVAGWRALLGGESPQDAKREFAG